MTRVITLVALIGAILAGFLALRAVDGDGTGGPVDEFEVTSGVWRPTAAGDDAAATTSPTFRARSRRADLDSPEVVLRFRIDEFGDHSGRQHDWDGVHVGLRYGSPDDLYYISVARRDGTVALKRKSGGAYETLAVADHELSLDEWHEATVAVEDTTVGTWLRLRLDGENVLEVLDTTDPLPPGGRVSLRSDNVAVTFADVQVRDRS